MEKRNILVVGATGYLGNKIATALVAKNENVTALVRKGTNPEKLLSMGVKAIEGDLTNRDSLDKALLGVTHIITSAIGCFPRRKGDNIQSVDEKGNKNLIEAAKKANIEKFIFISVATAEKAPHVPNFWQKKLIEDYLEKSKVPFVSIRPAAFIDQSPRALVPLFGENATGDLYEKDLRKGCITSVGNPKIKISMVLTDDLVKYIINALDEPKAVGKRIEISSGKPVSMAEMAEIFSRHLNSEIKVKVTPLWLMNCILYLFSKNKPMASYFRAMFKYFQTGTYVTDNSLQKEIFGEIPKIEDSLGIYLRKINLIE